MIHRRLWPVLALAVVLGLALALVLRAPPPAGSAQTQIVPEAMP